MMAMAVIRLAALAAVGYLLMATVLAVAAGMIRARPLQAAAGRLTPALVRRMATGGSGVGLALGAALGTVSVPDLAPHPIVATGAAGANGSADGDSAPGTHNMATMLRVDDHVATMTRTSDPPPPGLSPAPTAGVTGPVGHGDRPGPEEPGFIPAPRTPSSGPTNPTNPANATEASPPATGNGDGPTGLTASSGPTDPADATPPATGDGGSPAGPTAAPGPDRPRRGRSTRRR